MRHLQYYIGKRKRSEVYSQSSTKTNYDLTAVRQRTTTMHVITGIKKSTGYDCSVSGSECDMTIIIITADLVVGENPVGFNPPAGALIGKIRTDNSDLPPTQWIPTCENVTVVDPTDGSVSVIEIPSQTTYFSPENDAYLFYYSE
jgi:hypothetical protein